MTRRRKARIELRHLLLIFLLSALLAACVADDAGQEEPVLVEGPALVMFYTDN